MAFSLTQRQQMRARLGQEIFDLVVVGGGINGASIARDAALRGWSVALLEQRDFGFGTSSRSSRLIHGGLRYLEHGQLGLVFESVSERSLLAKLARNLVRPLPFVFPVYKGEKPLGLINMGLWLYDTLAMFRNYRLHRQLTPLEVQQQLAGIRAEGLRGAVHYYDYQTDDGRLVLENVLSARAAGAATLSYMQVQELLADQGRRTTLRVRDHLRDEELIVRGRAVVIAAGPWTDEVLARAGDRHGWLRPTKGSHLVLPKEKLPLDQALVMRHPKDGRVVFILPYYERTVIGTTDTDFKGDLAELRVTAEDVEYLLDVARSYFPQRQLHAADVIATWSGIRPLLTDEAADAPSAVSREHRIDARRDGLVVIAGGKLTTYRRMAQQCVEAATAVVEAGGGRPPRRQSLTRSQPLPGAEGLESEEDLAALARKLEGRCQRASSATHLALTYGARAERVLQLIDEDRALREPLSEELPHIWAEIVFAAREEMALTLSDALVRRTQLFYRARDQGLSVAAEAAALMAQELRWDAAEQARQLDAYRQEVAADRAWQHDAGGAA